MDALGRNEVKRIPEPNICSPLLMAGFWGVFGAVPLGSEVVGPQGFEPWTFGLKGSRSPFCEFCDEVGAVRYLEGNRANGRAAVGFGARDRYHSSMNEWSGP